MIQTDRRTRPILIMGAVLWCLAGLPALGQELPCEANQGPCRTMIQASTVTLDISPKPVTAMRESTFLVTIAGAQPEQPPVIELGMPAMRMGPHQVKLRQVNPGVYTGTGVIVRCPSGKRTWFANITLPGLGEARFVFDVVY